MEARLIALKASPFFADAQCVLLFPQMFPATSPRACAVPSTPPRALFESGGRWNSGSLQLPSQFAQLRARRTPEMLRGAAAQLESVLVGLARCRSTKHPCGEAVGCPLRPPPGPCRPRAVTAGRHCGRHCRAPVCSLCIDVRSSIGAGIGRAALGAAVFKTRRQKRGACAYLSFWHEHFPAWFRAPSAKRESRAPYGMRMASGGCPPGARRGRRRFSWWQGKEACGKGPGCREREQGRPPLHVGRGAGLA